eukprot:CAMPEP_0117585346 /NCGR_PEP_ID=MMETSP0784-20121206/68094_1 /TAXON_ID=39447 /ORGANISM="" /LENGTH=137 /DNA_ID=CAMNT_0005386283 /DNA_START=261 /DNA_END=671 /DNA_ORIENTATION=-
MADARFRLAFERNNGTTSVRSVSIIVWALSWLNARDNNKSHAMPTKPVPLPSSKILLPRSNPGLSATYANNTMPACQMRPAMPSCKADSMICKGLSRPGTATCEHPRTSTSQAGSCPSSSAFSPKHVVARSVSKDQS